MANHRDGQGRTGNGDQAAQREVLILLVDKYPEGLNLSDLEAQLGDATVIEAAVEELIEVEVLEREGDVVVPTPAARRGSRLLRLYRGSGSD